MLSLNILIFKKPVMHSSYFMFIFFIPEFLIVTAFALVLVSLESCILKSIMVVFSIFSRKIDICVGLSN